jgi:hypothetical protein
MVDIDKMYSSTCSLAAWRDDTRMSMRVRVKAGSDHANQVGLVRGCPAAREAAAGQELGLGYIKGWS